MGIVQVKRIYEAANKADGNRILVDRLWPRGVTKDAAQLDEWMKDVAPSVSLRKWFNHEPAKWDEFFLRYTAELKDNAAIAALLKAISKHHTTTLLYAAHDEQHNHALVLQNFLIQSMAR